MSVQEFHGAHNGALTVDDWRQALHGVKPKRDGSGFMALCPAHDDKNPSLSVDVKDGKILVNCFAGCEYADVRRAAGLERDHAWTPRPNGSTGSSGKAKPPKTYTTRAVYSGQVFEFKAPSGEVLYVQRHKGPYFRPVGEDKWVSGLEGINAVPYNLPALLDGAGAGETIFHVEGCKDVDTATRMGLTATTTGGTETWRPEFRPHYAGAHVVLLSDNDPAGRDYAETVASSLQGTARSVKVVELPDLPPKGDLTDFVEAGGTKEDLLSVVEAAPEFERQEVIREAAEDAWTRCAELAVRENITAEFANTLHAKGVAGESNQIRFLYLAVMSRRLKKPVNVAVKGPSSGGKSYLVEQVLGAFPESSYYALSSMSEKALIYLDEDMRHRFLVIYEASGMAGDMQTYLIRTLLSEGQIRYQTAESTSNGVKPRLLEMEGPTGLIVTTTQTRMHPENETRLFSLLVTDSRQQTADILMAMADEDREPVSMDDWRDLQTWIEGQPCEVYIPYSKELAALVPPVTVRLRRDFMAVLQLVRAHAVLHQATRERDEKGRIVASLEDYRVVRELVAALVAEGVDATVPETIRETVSRVKELTDDADEPHVGLRRLAEELRLDKSAASRRWQHARDAGYLKNLEDGKGKAAKIALGESLPADKEILPTVEALRNRCTVARPSGGTYTPHTNKHRTVAIDFCNGLQRCNGSTHDATACNTKDSVNAGKTLHNTHNVLRANGKTGEGGNESATVQRFPSENQNDHEPDATVRSVQRLDHREDDEDWVIDI